MNKPLDGLPKATHAYSRRPLYTGVPCAVAFYPNGNVVKIHEESDIDTHLRNGAKVHLIDQVPVERGV